MFTLYYAGIIRYACSCFIADTFVHPQIIHKYKLVRVLKIDLWYWYCDRAQLGLNRDILHHCRRYKSSILLEIYIPSIL